MKIDHIAIWTNQLENLKHYYIKYFDGVANQKYENREKKFSSYFLSFNNGTKLEIMHRPGIPANQNDPVFQQYRGLIHFAFMVDNHQQLKDKAEHLKADGFPILSGPRTTGDGYYEFVTLDPDNNRIEVTCYAQN